MHPLSRADAEALVDLNRQLATVPDSASPRPHLAWTDGFRELLGFETVAFYGIQLDEDSIAPTFTYAAGGTSREHWRAMLSSIFGAARSRWGVFNPARPEPQQQNVALVFPPRDEMLRRFERPGVIHPLGVKPTELEAARQGYLRASEGLGRLGLADQWQFRVLLCQDDWLLCWGGGFRRAPPTEREVALFRAVVPSLHKRLALEQLLGSPLTPRSLCDALETVSRVAFVTDAKGVVLHANAFGRVRLDGRRSDTQDAIWAAIASRGESGGYTVAPLSTGGPLEFLLIGHAASIAADRLSSASARWALTPRQTEVLELAVAGESNKAIGGRLGCSERTVELHMKALLKKASVRSRSELAAKFWTTF